MVVNHRQLFKWLPIIVIQLINTIAFNKSECKDNQKLEAKQDICNQKY